MLALFRNRRFRQYWLVNEAAHLAVWMNTLAVGWLMTRLSDSALMVAAVQAAFSLPIAAIVLPAGVVADHMERARFLRLVNLWMASIATTMGVLHLADLLTAEVLLATTALLALGMGANFPASQAMSAELVAEEQIGDAAALNTMGSNMARSFGPVFGSGLLAVVGATSIFFFNAVSRSLLAFMYHRWAGAAGAPSPTIPTSMAVPERPFALMAANAAFRRLILLTLGFFATGSAFWSLLPVYADRLNSGAGTAGALGLAMGSAGAGAVAGAMMLAWARKRLSTRMLVGANALACSGALALLAQVPTLAATIAAGLLFGAGWGGQVAQINGRAQAAFGKALRAKAISFNILAMYVGMGTGSLVWGSLSDAAGLPTALGTAAASIAVLALVARAP